LLFEEIFIAEAGDFGEAGERPALWRARFFKFSRRASISLVVSFLEGLGGISIFFGGEFGGPGPYTLTEYLMESPMEG
jgi:hypothetical protein